MSEFVEDYCTQCHKPFPFRKGRHALKCVKCGFEIAAPTPVTLTVIWNQIQAISITDQGISFFGTHGRVLMYFEACSVLEKYQAIAMEKYQTGTSIVGICPHEQSAKSFDAILLDATPEFWTAWNEQKELFKRRGFGVMLSQGKYTLYCQTSAIRTWLFNSNAIQTHTPDQLITEIINLDRIKERSRRPSDYDLFESLLTQYFQSCNGKNDIIALTINPHDAHDFTEPDKDPRFSYYQFLKFKFKGINSVLTTLPFKWFTEHVMVNPEENYPKVDDLNVLRLLLLKEKDQNLPENPIENHPQVIVNESTDPEKNH